MFHLKLHTLKLMTLLSAVIVNFIALSLTATSAQANIAPYTPSSRMAKPNIVERHTPQGTELFYISNGKLIHQFKGKKEQIIADTHLKELYLYQNKYVVGFSYGLSNNKKIGSLFMLLPDEKGQELTEITGVFGKVTRTWHWKSIATKVSDVVIDNNDILIIYNGQWGVFSTPTLMLFTAQKDQLVRRNIPMVRQEGLDCTASAGFKFCDSHKAWQDLNLQIVNFESIGYDNNDMIAIKFKGFRHPVALEIIKAAPEEFATRSKFFASKN